MNDKTEKEVYKVYPLKKICMTIGELPTSYLESMTYYEMLVWFINYLRDNIIPTVNNNAEAVEELQNLYEELRTYVNDYFDNLDVQEEINNKLDAMLEDGTLQEIIADYLNSKAIFGFDNVASMKEATNLIDGSYARTLGYHNKNDGGSALYKIRNITNEDIIDNMLLINLSNNNLVAELIIENNTLNIKQMGAKEVDLSLTKFDIKPYILKYIEYLDKNNDIKLYIPSGKYYSSQIDIARKEGFYIYGDESFSLVQCKGTIISSISDNQNYIFNLGNTLVETNSWTLKNIVLSSADYKISNNNIIIDNGNVKNISYCINMIYCNTGITDNLFFTLIKGGALQVSTSWEIYWKLLNFRYIYNINGSVINFKNANKSLSQVPNITANIFDNLMFETCYVKSLIYFEQGSNFQNNIINNINVEEGYSLNLFGTTSGTNTADINNDVNTHHIAIFDGYRCELTISNIDIDVMASRYFDSNNNRYVFDRIFTHSIPLGGMSCLTSNLSISNANYDITLYYLRTTEYGRTRNIVSNINNNTGYNIKYDTQGSHDLLAYSRLNHFGIDNEEMLPSQITPAYKNANKFGGGTYGLLYSDSESINDLKLCVKPFPQNFNSNSITTKVTGTKLIIRAKIPNNETVSIRLASPTGIVTSDLVGTGVFKNYDIDLTNIINDANDRIGLRLLNTTSSTNILIDYFYSK